MAYSHMVALRLMLVLGSILDTLFNDKIYPDF